MTPWTNKPSRGYIVTRNLIPSLGAWTKSCFLAAADIKLSADEIQRVEEIIHPERVAGTRYDAHQMKCWIVKSSCGSVQNCSFAPNWIFRDGFAPEIVP